MDGKMKFIQIAADRMKDQANIVQKQNRQFIAWRLLHVWRRLVVN
jgi:hypothetical protein